MPYHTDDKNVTLDGLKERIKATDLVPSRAPLLEDIDGHLRKLGDAGISTLADLRKSIKTPRSIDSLSQKAGVDRDYLVLLRREVEGWYPKPAQLRDFHWLDRDKIAMLEDRAFINAAQLFDAIEAHGEKTAIGSDDAGFSGELAALVDLTRIQWVSPLAAKMLFDSGYHSAASVAAADVAALTGQLEKINSGSTYFKGNIGRRDVGRLIKAASYVL